MTCLILAGSNVFGDTTTTSLGDPTSRSMRDDEVTCSCFSRESIERINSMNIDTARSCQDSSKPSIWLQQEDSSTQDIFFHSYGFKMEENSMSCLAEGDMMFMLSNEEEKTKCVSMISDACTKAGQPMPGCDPLLE